MFVPLLQLIFLVKKNAYFDDIFGWRVDLAFKTFVQYHTCLQVELKFSHEREARAVDWFFVSVCSKSARVGAGANY